MNTGMNSAINAFAGQEPGSGRKGMFVDSIDGDVARVMMPDGRTQEVPVSQLPPGTREGQTIGGGDEGAFDSEATERRRKSLADDDDGSMLKL